VRTGGDGEEKNQDMKSKIGNPSSGLLLLCGVLVLFLAIKFAQAQQFVRVEPSIEAVTDWDLVLQALEATLR